MQPTLRFKKVHAPDWGDGVIDEGVSYAPKIVWFEFTMTSGSSATDFLYVPPGTYVEEAVVVITEALDAGANMDLGTDGDKDALIDNTDITEDAVGVADSSNTAPMGLYFSAGDNLRLSVEGTTNQGTVYVKLTMWNFIEMIAQGAHNSFDVS
jgi:hypothetical protein